MQSAQSPPVSPAPRHPCNIVLTGLDPNLEVRIRHLVESSESLRQSTIERVGTLAAADESLRVARGIGAQILIAALWTAAEHCPTQAIMRLQASRPKLAILFVGDDVVSREAEVRGGLGPEHRLLFVERSFSDFSLLQLLRIGLTTVCVDPRSLTQSRPKGSLSGPSAEHEVDSAQSRWAFERDVAQALKELAVSGKKSAVCVFGIDRFHAMLDRFGAAAQSYILRQIRRCIDDAMRRHYRVLRIGEDEFGVVIHDTDAENANAMVERVLIDFREAHLQWRGVDIPLTASAGVTDTSHETRDVAELMLAADIALQAARAAGGNRSRIYHQADSVLVGLMEQSDVLSDIESALAAGSFRLFAQLIVPTAANEPINAEILLRVVDKTGALSPPGKFLLAAERFGISPRVDRWVVDHALSAFRNWGVVPGLGHISINLSGRTLMDVPTLEWIEARFRDAAVPRGSICFEITETAAIDRWSVAAPFIDRLRALGALFSLDDFGAGFSSFSYLESVPADFLKIDGSFIKQCTTDQRRLALARSLNEIGHLFGKRTIAEFVENTAILRAVTEMGIDYAQGYFSGLPFAAENIGAEIAKWRA